MNKVILMGRLTRDPEVRYTQGEQAMAVARYTLAVDRRGKNQENSADFIQCVAFGKAGEFAERYLHKGTKTIMPQKFVVNTYCNADFEEVVVLHNLAGYRVFSDCQKKGTSAAYRYGDEFPYDAELTLKRRKKVEEMKKEFCELFHQQRDNTSYWVDDLGQLNVKINTYQTALDAANWTKGRHFIVEV